MSSIVSYHPRVHVIDGTILHIVYGICSDWMSDLDFLRAIAAAGNVTRVGQVVSLAYPSCDKSVNEKLAKLGIYDVRSETITQLPPNIIPVGWNYTL